MRFVFKGIVLLALLALAAGPAAWRVRAQDGGQTVSVQRYDLRAGIQSQAALFAADGTRIALLNPSELCIVGVDGQVQRCRELEVPGLNIEDARWSPDGRYLALAQDFYRLMIDSDIWLFDTTTGGLLNLTEDFVQAVDLRGETDAQVDILPRWSSDGSQLMFVRYRVRDGVRLTPQLCIVSLGAASISMPDCAGEFPAPQDASFPIFALDWDDTHGQIAVIYSAPGDDQNSGLWIAKQDGSAARQVLAGRVSDLPLLTVKFAPDGNALLVFLAPGPRMFTPDNSPLRLVRLDEPALELIDPGQYVYSAGWSPEGSRVAYLVSNPLAGETQGLYVTEEPGLPGTLMLPGRYLPTTPRHTHLLTWSSAGTVLLTQADAGYTLAVVRLLAD